MGRGERDRSAAYKLTLYGIGILVATGTFPVGLYHSYALEFHFSAAMVTLLASCSTIGVIAAVVLFGRASDALGRKPVLLPALVIGALCVAAMLVAQNVWTLLAARSVSGLAIGLFTGAGTAALTELAPPGQTRRAATQAATAGILGFASGPVVGGIFVEYGPYPLRLVYAVGLVLLIPAFVGVIVMPETMTERRRVPLRPQRLEVPADGRKEFALASVVCLCAFAAASFFQSLGPTVAVQLLSVQNLAVAGAVASCFLTTSAIAQMRYRSLPIRRQTVTGLLILPVGLVMIAVGLVAESAPVFIAGALVGGFGQGLAYVGGQSLVEVAAPPERRAEAFSTYLVVLYVTGSSCAISLGLAAKEFGLYRSSVVYAGLAALLSLGTAAYAARTAIRQVAARPAATAATGG
jgi:MFS family permease